MSRWTIKIKFNYFVISMAENEASNNNLSQKEIVKERIRQEQANMKFR